MADIRTNLRVPEELYEAAKVLSERERRSINAQIVVLLQEALDARASKEQKPEKHTMTGDL